MNIQAQFRVFLDRLVEETSSLSLKEVKELKSKKMIRTFIMKPDLHKNIEMVICVGCRFDDIAKYNIHNNELRCISEETAHLEMFVRKTSY